MTSHQNVFISFKWINAASPAILKLYDLLSKHILTVHPMSGTLRVYVEIIIQCAHHELMFFIILYEQYTLYKNIRIIR